MGGLGSTMRLAWLLTSMVSAPAGSSFARAGPAPWWQLWMRSPGRLWDRREEVRSSLGTAWLSLTMGGSLILSVPQLSL